MKNVANFLTFSRIILSIALFCFQPFTAPFYVIYMICGLTDIADGRVARVTRSVTQFGATLDSIADLVFILVCMIKVLPAIELHTWMLVWTAILVAIRIINAISGFVCQRKLIMLHTTANKFTGMLLFIIPMILPVLKTELAVIPVCAVATFAAIQEGHLIRKK